MAEQTTSNPTTTTTNLDPIPTPMRLQFKRIRYQVLPVVIFVISLALTIWLWRDYAGSPNGYGAVTTVSVHVTAPRDGVLMLAEGDEYPRLYEHVEKDQLIGKFEANSARLITQQQAVEEELSSTQDRLTKAREALAEAEKGTDKAKQEQFKGQIATLRSTLTDLRSQFDRLDQKIASSKVVVPAAGTVTAIHRQPNEFVKQGQEIMTITQDSGACIVSYVRPGTGVVPKKNMKVLVRNQATKKSEWTIVQEVGQHVEPVPEQQLTNAKRPEWGIPVRIAMPQKMGLRPGELVVLNFSKE